MNPPRVDRAPEIGVGEYARLGRGAVKGMTAVAAVLHCSRTGSNEWGIVQASPTPSGAA